MGRQIPWNRNGTDKIKVSLPVTEQENVEYLPSGFHDESISYLLEFELLDGDFYIKLPKSILETQCEYAPASLTFAKLPAYTDLLHLSVYFSFC